MVIKGDLVGEEQAVLCPRYARLRGEEGRETRGDLRHCWHRHRRRSAKRAAPGAARNQQLPRLCPQPRAGSAAAEPGSSSREPAAAPRRGEGGGRLPVQFDSGEAEADARAVLSAGMMQQLAEVSRSRGKGRGARTDRCQAGVPGAHGTSLPAVPRQGIIGQGPADHHSTGSPTLGSVSRATSLAGQALS